MSDRTLPQRIRKRDGTIVAFDPERIVRVISKAMTAAGEGPNGVAAKVAKAVLKDVQAEARRSGPAYLPTVEGVQDLVERQLILHGFVKTSKAYILYRQRRAELRQQKGEVPREVRELTATSRKYFRNPLAEFVYYTTYSKWLPEKNRRETWVETVGRYLDFMRENLGDRLTEKEYAEINNYLLEIKALGSMRLLWAAGAAARGTNVCAYNCSFVAPAVWQDFAEIMYVLMCGTGVGFSVEGQTVARLPSIKVQTGKKLPILVISDSKEGWADAFALGLKTWADGADIEFDYSQIRPQGARLRTMGGRASGPGPLKALLDFSRERLLARQGRRLSTLDVHDIICKTGEVVVMGGVRRSALISLSDLDDQEMRTAKNGQFYVTHPERAMANNSAVYNQRPTPPQFLEEWVNLIKSGSGERGIFNRGSLKHQLPARRWRIFEPDAVTSGTNPCVTADTWVMTSRGARPVADLIGQPFQAMVNGVAKKSEGFFPTGEKAIFEIQTAKGFSFRATASHRVLVVNYRSRKIQKNTWKEVGKLKPGDQLVLHHHSQINWMGVGTQSEGWLLGSLLGDGNIEKSGKANLDYWGITQPVMMQTAVSLVHAAVGGRSDLAGHVAETGYARVQSTRLGNLALTYGIKYGHKRVTPEIERSSSEFYRGFLCGWFDADGSVQGAQQKGVSVRLSSSYLPNLQAAQRMLARLGIVSTLYANRRSAGRRLLPDGSGSRRWYNCAADHELLISGANLLTFAERINFSDPVKRDRLVNLLKTYRRRLNRENFSAKVVTISPVGVETVYDCQVDKAHAFDGNGFYLHNCGEIILKSKQFCNLSEVVARAEDTEDTLLEKVRVATILGTYQATLTHFPYLSKEWKKNCKEEALLGVSITGQWDCPAVRRPQTLRKMKEVAIETNRKYAARLGINPSTCITCVKPSGNGSQLFDSSSGMHPRHAPYYLRRVRIENHNPIFHLLRDLGVPHYPEVGQDPATASTYVLEFPVKSPRGAVCRDDVGAIEQLEYWKILKENYTEHNPSTTVSVGEDEWLRVANWIYENWDMIGGLSFLPRSEHVYRLAPYEAISEKRYRELLKKFPAIDFAKIVLYEYEDTTTGAKELACAAGTCEIDAALNAPAGQPGPHRG